MYLTDSINAHISSVVIAQRAVFHLAGHGKEEVKVFCDAVQLTDVFICTQKKRTHTVIEDSTRTVASAADAWLAKFEGLFFLFHIEAMLQTVKWHVQYLLELEWEWQEQTMNTPGGTWCGANWFIFCSRSVITDESLQPRLIKTNDSEGDMALGPMRHFRICSFLHHHPFINSLNGPGTTASTPLFPTALSLCNKAGPQASFLNPSPLGLKVQVATCRERTAIVSSGFFGPNHCKSK